MLIGQNKVSLNIQEESFFLSVALIKATVSVSVPVSVSVSLIQKKVRLKKLYIILEL